MKPEATRTQPQNDVQLSDALRAMVVLLADERDHRIGKSGTRTEIFLSEAGIGYKTIATLLGRSPDSVRMAVVRARKSYVENDKGVNDAGV